MNLLRDHVRVFRCYYGCVIAIYAVMAMGCIAWGAISHLALQRGVAMIHAQVEPVIVRVNRATLSMHQIKEQLTLLWGVSFKGIVLTELMFDPKGIHLQGSAQSMASLEVWLEKMSERFRVDEKNMHKDEASCVRFEMVAHAIH